MSQPIKSEPVSCSCGFIFYRLESWPDGRRTANVPVPIALTVVDGPNHIVDALCPKCRQKTRMNFPPGNVSSPPPSGEPQISNDPYKLPDAIIAGETLGQVLAGVKLEEIRKPAASFSANVQRIISLAEFPGLCCGLTFLSQNSNLRIASAHRQNDDKTVTDEHSKVVTYHESPLSASSRADALKWGNLQIIQWAQIHQEIVPGIESVFAAQLTGAWTAFETLAGDLWEAALNSHPQGLSDMKDVDGTSHSGSGSPSVSIPLKLFQQKGYDLRSLMGTALRKTCNFAVLEGIRDAYNKAFRKNGGSVEAALADKSLDALSAVRNLIVHKNGLCDDEYIEREKKVRPRIPKLSLHEKLPIDGARVKNLIDPAVACAVKLIRSVDAWIVAHPVKS